MDTFRGKPNEEAFRLERMLDAAYGSPRPLAGLEVAVSATTTVADVIRDMTKPVIAAEAWSAIVPPANHKLADTLREYKTVSELAQEFTCANYALSQDVMTSLSQPTDALHLPLSQYMSNLSSAADIGAALTSSWKPVLTRQSWLSEASFVNHLSEVERLIYAAVRPELSSVAELLDKTYERGMLDLGVRWLGSKEMNFEFDLSFDLLPDSELSERAPIVRSPLQDIDPMAPYRVLRRGLQRVVLIGGRPYKVLRVVSAGTTALVGIYVGEAVGNSALGAVIAPTVHEVIVLLIERRRKP